MAHFEYRLSEAHNDDQLYTPVDDAFDVRTLRVEEGLVINAYENDRIDCLGKYVIDDTFLTCNRE